MMERAAVESSGFATYRAKLLVAMALVVVAITAIGLYIVLTKVAVETEHDLQRDFRAALESIRWAREVRHAALAERCRALVRRPRIHAALEDNALDLLYPSARDELRDITGAADADAESDPREPVLRARFYRFLDGQGAVIPAPGAAEAGALSPADERRLALKSLPERQELGYLRRIDANDVETLDELIAMPIVSTESGEVISAIVLGFKPVIVSSMARRMASGVWMDGRLHLPAAAAAQGPLGAEVGRALAGGVEESSLRVSIGNVPHQLFFGRLNGGSRFPPAYEVCLYPLTELLARQRQLLWQGATACGVLLLGGIGASHFLAVRLSKPVEKLAATSEENRAQRVRAEAALELTAEELQRSARFSADTSHQLKTPVTVLRAGLEELFASEQLTPEMRDEIASLIHQTFRLTHIIEDLLLLSRMDAGRMRLEFEPVNLNRMIEAWLDDLSAIPEGPDVEVELDLPEALEIAGERRYTALIVENLLVNARKYNRVGGQIKIFGDEEGDWAVLRIGNTGHPIPPEVREHIFERFHRGLMAENVPGHGLGLNLARELVRLHHGELRLTRSDEEWTEFELRFRLARQISGEALAVS